MGWRAFIATLLIPLVSFVSEKFLSKKNKDREFWTREHPKDGRKTRIAKGVWVSTLLFAIGYNVLVWFFLGPFIATLISSAGIPLGLIYIITGLPAVMFMPLIYFSGKDIITFIHSFISGHKDKLCVTMFIFEAGLKEDCLNVGEHVPQEGY